MRIPLLAIALLVYCVQGLAQTQQFQAVPFTAVKFNDTFWAPRLKTNREISIPHNFKWCLRTI